MSNQPWVWDAATNQYAWSPEIAALPGHHPNTPSRPEENSRSAHGVPYSQGPPAPGPTASNLRDTQADMPHAIYPPNSFTYWPSANHHCPIITPTQAPPWSVLPQPDPSLDHNGYASVLTQPAGRNEVSQTGRQRKRSPSPAFPYTLPPPSPPPAPARPKSVPPQHQHDIYLPPPSPPPTYAHPACSSTLVRCHCCLRNPVSFREVGVDWCAECFEMVQSRRQR